MADLDSLTRGAVQVVTREELEKKLSLKRPLRVKLGVDPTSPDLHLGHTVALNFLRRFQDLGHTIVFIIGDYTARIGDPSGKSETRPTLSAEEIDRHAATYLSQVFKILDEKNTEVHRNAAWLSKLFANTDARRNVLELMAGHTVQQLLEREDFQKRMKEGTPISLLELLYPLLQGFDSVAVKADVEVGGTDQLFNLLMGRTRQKTEGLEPQVVITLPLLEGLDGVKKMSKSYGNHIALNDSPNDMFGKVMRLSDEMMWKYYQLLTEENPAPLKSGHPMEAKKNLGRMLVARYHDAEAATKARDHFERVFSQREAPERPPEHHLSRATMRVMEILVEAGIAPSKNEARRLIGQGAVELAGERVAEDRDVTVHAPLLIKVGKWQFRTLLPPQ